MSNNKESVHSRLISILVIFMMVIGVTASGFLCPLEVRAEDQRAAGDNRYGTAFAVAEEIYKLGGPFDNVVIASGRNFPDALSGAYLAKVLNAPIMLETPSLDGEIVSYIGEHMKPGGRVYILGGTAAVPAEFEALVKTYGLFVERLEGPNRYATNMSILNAMIPKIPEPSLEGAVKPIAEGVTKDALLVASGKNYADALSGSAVGYPMLLVEDGLTYDQIDFLSYAGFKKIYILGGQSAVNGGIESALRSIMGEGAVERISGINRYDTGRKVANRFFPEASAVTLASGKDFPDGLSGAPLAMKHGSPILLTAKDEAAYAKSYIVAKGIKDKIIIGGQAALPDKLIEELTITGDSNEGHVHIWTTSFKWNDQMNAATAEFKCLDCDEKSSKDANIGFKIIKPATHAESGMVQLTASAKAPDGVNKTSVKVKLLPKLLHNITWDWDEEKYNSGNTFYPVRASAYTGTAGWGSMAASGKPAVHGTIAVDRRIIPFGTKVYVEGYGFAVANDTGGAILGHSIDVVLESYNSCIQWGIRYPNMYIIG